MSVMTACLMSKCVAGHRPHRDITNTTTKKVGKEEKKPYFCRFFWYKNFDSFFSPPELPLSEIILVMKIIEHPRIMSTKLHQNLVSHLTPISANFRTSLLYIRLAVYIFGVPQANGNRSLVYYLKSISKVLQKCNEDQTQHESDATTKTQRFLTLSHDTKIK